MVHWHETVRCTRTCCRRWVSRLRRYGWNTSTEGSLRRKKEGEKKKKKKEKNKVEEIQLANLVSLGSLASKNQSGAWYAKAVDRAVIRKLEKIKTLQRFKKFSGWRSRRNLPWVAHRMSCKRSIKANLYIYFTCRVGMMINPQILEFLFKSVYVMTTKLSRFRLLSLQE